MEKLIDFQRVCAFLRKMLFSRRYRLSMPSFCVTPAIVLRSWPYGESDKIVSFLTETFGKVTGIAKGAKRSRRRFVNTLEPFSLVNLRFQERSNSTLMFVLACDLVRPFKGLTTSLQNIAHASYLVEIADRLTREHDENRPLFEHLREGLSFVDEKGTSLFFLVFFELKLLQLAGYRPMLRCCRRCEKNWSGEIRNHWCFSPRDGGVLCESCSPFRKESMPLSTEALHALATFQDTEDILSCPLSFSPSALREGHSILIRFIQFQVDKELNSVSFLEAFCPA
jgi:DNA repair protein RecO (recombination protein O)